MLEQQFLELRRQVIEREFSRMNDRQLEAVTTTEGPLLVLAGAGSGKTTVLVNRIANIIKYGKAYQSDELCRSVTEADVQFVQDYLDGKLEELPFDVQDLLSVYPAKPWQILAITFTNKAANELKDRLGAFLGDEALDIWAGTFHSVCSRILRRYGDRLGYSNHFTIYDTDDSKRVMKECQRLLNIDDKIMPHKEILSAISRAKERLLTPAEYEKETKGDIRTSRYAECYALYQKLLMQADAMDFDDMIFNAVKLLEQEPEVREHYQNQFRYVLVDEYQDTDPAQYVLTSLLAGKRMNICVVGDDDQSIYGFRGATIENILNFESNYKNAKTIRLEQNYRSTGNILNAANEVIAHNTQRKGKNLWTNAGDGDKITLFTAANAMMEGQYIADVIETDVSNGRQFSDHAILYRSNAQSSSIESAFIKAGIPYKIIGGRRFYERKEIRDAIAYLTVIDNPADNVKLRRIINEPKRGIGDTTVNAAADIAAGLGTSIYEVICHPDEYAKLSRCATKLQKFTHMIDGFRNNLEDADMSAFFDELMEQTGYLDSLKADRERFEERRENLEELKNNIVRYMQETEGGDLSGFLAASYQRGIDFVQIPTTLLSAVDSSVGGKTAINLPEGKNLAGAFKQPVAVIMDTDTLQTLKPEVFADGCAEVIKYGMIWDEMLFRDLQTNVLPQCRDNAEIVTDIIARCVDIKRQVVVEDELDRGIRNILNFGHTIGHSIEKNSHFEISHGSAVAMGMAIVTDMAENAAICEKGTVSELKTLLEEYGLPTEAPFTTEQLLEGMLSDKKIEGSEINLILPQHIGKCFIGRMSVSKAQVLLGGMQEKE